MSSVPAGWRTCVAAAAISIAASLPAAAQDEIDRERPSRESAIEATVLEASKAAAEAARLGAPVTYDQILADPDNLDLNFRYAKTQVAQGDLKGATATLERILLIRPDMLDMQLFYALVLVRLDNLDEAEQLLTELRAKPLPEEAQRQVADSLRQLQRQRRRMHFSTSTSLGYGMDSNRNAAAASKKRLFADVELPLTDNSRKRRDTNVLLLQNVTAAYDLDRKANHQVFGSFDYFLGEQTSVDDLDLSSYSGTVGASLTTPLVNVTPTYKHDHLLLSRETYLRSDEIGLSANHAVSQRFQVRGESSWTHEDYVGITENSVAHERTGDRLAVGGGIGVILTPAMRLDWDVTYEKKDAKLPYNAYDGFSFDYRHTWLLGHGQFFVTALNHGLDSYNAPDAAVSTLTRQDKSVRARFTYGLPMGLLTGRLLPASLVKDMTASTSFEQYRAVSKLQTYTYNNSKWSLLLTKIIDF